MIRWNCHFLKSALFLLNPAHRIVSLNVDELVEEALEAFKNKEIAVVDDQIEEQKVCPLIYIPIQSTL